LQESHPISFIVSTAENLQKSITHTDSQTDIQVILSTSPNTSVDRRRKLKHLFTSSYARPYYCAKLVVKSLLHKPFIVSKNKKKILVSQDSNIDRLSLNGSRIVSCEAYIPVKRSRTLLVNNQNNNSPKQ
jgi:hypothetical protein